MNLTAGYPLFWLKESLIDSYKTISVFFLFCFCFLFCLVLFFSWGVMVVVSLKDSQHKVSLYSNDILFLQDSCVSSQETFSLISKISMISNYTRTSVNKSQTYLSLDLQCTTREFLASQHLLGNIFKFGMCKLTIFNWILNVIYSSRFYLSGVAIA